MIRIVKLAAYSLMGYVIYELVMGILDGEASATPAKKEVPIGRAPGKPSPVKATNSRLRGNKSVEVEDDTGAKHRQTVGRGVV